MSLLPSTDMAAVTAHLNDCHLLEPCAPVIPGSQLLLKSPNLQVAKEIWVCENGSVKIWNGSIRDYKKLLAKKMGVLT